MEKNKVLIYKNEKQLKPIGGPNGYVYNLKKGLESLQEKSVQFLNLPENNTNINENISFGKKIYNIIKSIYKLIFKNTPKFIENYKLIRYCDVTLRSKKESEIIEKCNSKYIHFHSTFDMYSVKDSLKKYKGKTILTSHSPKPTYLEVKDMYVNEKNAKILSKKFEALEKIDEYAFNNADYIIFPCKEAEEPYYNQWNKYSEIKEKNKEKYRYILSGIPKCSAKLSKKQVRKEYNIPEEAFLMCFVGRHNEVKGYDVLKQIGQEVLQEKNNIYIIVAGKEGPLYKLNNERWIEVGWTNDPYSIIAASDLFILPNRETYFDLVFLEVLSLGIPILASWTGGNKYFKKYENSGIYYFEDVKEAKEKILKLINLPKKEIEEKGLRNKEIYQKDFNEKIFAKNYIKLIDSL